MKIVFINFTIVLLKNYFIIIITFLYNNIFVIVSVIFLASDLCSNQIYRGLQKQLNEETRKQLLPAIFPNVLTRISLKNTRFMIKYTTLKSRASPKLMIDYIAYFL